MKPPKQKQPQVDSTLPSSGTCSRCRLIIEYYRLSHDVVTCDVDRDVSTAYCLSSSGDEVDWLCVTF